MSEDKNYMGWIAGITVIAIVLAFVSFYLYHRAKTYPALQSEDFYPSIKVIVYNGCGFTGVANNVKNNLSDKNIDVIGTGNTRKFIYDETLIVVKRIDDIDLRRLQRMTGIHNVIYSVNNDFFAPFIIIAGKDYQRYFKAGS
jgi:heme/copper-type cytochrome/quinol oxidase subunit 2